MIPQIIILMLGFGAFVVAVIKHGEPINAKYSMFRKLFQLLIAHSILYWGGFYDILLK
jgi:hypothetical protein